MSWVLKFKIIGAFIAAVVYYPLCFLYKKFPNFFTSIFSAVNDSLWEQAKVIFGSILIGGITQKLISIVNKIHVNNICFSTFISAIVAIPIYIVLVSILSSLLGKRYVIKILGAIASIVIAQVISYFIMQKPEFKLENYTIIFAIITYIIFTFVTYFRK